MPLARLMNSVIGRRWPRGLAANTVRAWKADWEIFTEFCGRVGAQSMPASAKTVRDFVFECLAKQKEAGDDSALCVNHRAGAPCGGGG